MDDFSIYIYIAFILLSLLGGFLKKKKPTQASQPQKTPTAARPQKNTTSEKSFNEILEEIKRGLAGQQTENTPTSSYEMKVENNYLSEEKTSLEEIITDDDDHFLKNRDTYFSEEKTVAQNQHLAEDWCRAIILSTILDKPKALKN